MQSMVGRILMRGFIGWTDLSPGRQKRPIPPWSIVNDIKSPTFDMFWSFWIATVLLNCPKYIWKVAEWVWHFLRGVFWITQSNGVMCALHCAMMGLQLNTMAKLAPPVVIQQNMFERCWNSFGTCCTLQRLNSIETVLLVFLAVQDSSIGDIVTHSVIN